VDKVLIIAHYCGDLDGRYSNRFVYIAKLLSVHFDVELITSDFYHTKKEKKKVTGEYPFKITLIEEPRYPKNVSIKRLFSHWVFGRNLRSYLKTKNDKCIVYASFPSFSIAKEALEHSQRVDGFLVVDIQDLWPESFKPFIGKNTISKAIIKYFSKKVDLLFLQSQGIVTVSKTYLKRADGLTNDSVFKLPVYIGADNFPQYSFENRFPDNKSNIVRLLYLGSLGESYDIITAIKAFEMAKEKLNRSISLEFDIIGDGPKRKYFEVFANSISSSVKFKGLISYEEVQELIPNYDIGINPISGWSIASIINKHGDYAMASLPVLNTQNSEEYIELLKHYECGLTSSPESVEELASNMIKLASDVSLLTKMRKNARIMGDEMFNRSLTYKVIVDNLVSLKFYQGEKIS